MSHLRNKLSNGQLVVAIWENFKSVQAHTINKISLLHCHYMKLQFYDFFSQRRLVVQYWDVNTNAKRLQLVAHVIAPRGEKLATIQKRV